MSSKPVIDVGITILKVYNTALLFIEEDVTVGWAGAQDDGIKWFISGKIYYVFAVNNRAGAQPPVLHSTLHTEQYH